MGFDGWGGSFFVWGDWGFVGGGEGKGGREMGGRWDMGHDGRD